MNRQRQTVVAIGPHLGNAFADGRRLDMRLLGRSRHIAVVAPGHQQAQGLQVDVSHELPPGLPPGSPAPRSWVSGSESLCFPNTSLSSLRNAST
jgi:hypothetical protein